MTRTAVRSLPLAALAALVAACQLPGELTALDDPSPVPPNLSALTVAQEDTGYHYDRDDWPHWSHHGDGCDTRELVLHDEGRDVTKGKACRALAGTWTSAYDGVTVHDPSELDIDHIVPLGEAADSGVRAWSEVEREAFANDRENLIAVTASSNREKSDQDPAEWLPATDYRCDYARRWVSVKAKYGLTVDPAERSALAAVLGKCPR